MPGREDAKQYRVRAEHCLAIAAEMNDLSRRMLLIDMAQAWMRLADQAERNQTADLVYETPSPAPDKQQVTSPDFPSPAHPPSS